MTRRIGLLIIIIKMINKLIFILFLTQISCFSSEILTENQINRIADAIYRAENSKTYPYGIKSIKTNGNKEFARKICLNTIRNNHKRWLNSDKSKDFITFLGDRYCPAKDDPQGNINWKKNVKKFLAN